MFLLIPVYFVFHTKAQKLVQNMTYSRRDEIFYPSYLINQWFSNCGTELVACPWGGTLFTKFKNHCHWISGWRKWFRRMRKNGRRWDKVQILWWGRNTECVGGRTNGHSAPWQPRPTHLLTITYSYVETQIDLDEALHFIPNRQTSKAAFLTPAPRVRLLYTPPLSALHRIT